MSRAAVPEGNLRYSIREATREDVSDILRLIKQLAVYEKEPNAVEVTTDTLLKDGFGDEKLFNCLVAEIEDSHEVVAFALYFNNYSTWQGKMLYLEDLYVEKDYRGHGIGKSLLIRLTQIAKDTNCCRIHWIVLNWNEGAIDFYNGVGAKLLTDWRLCQLDRSGITKLSQ